MLTKITKKEKQLLDLTVYQIYPRSFCDGNGDGVGDLQGIFQKVSHIAELHANAVWICPCYPSPCADNGYDVSDYKNIHPMFGDMSDWERLQARLQKENIKLIMDFVANHTSDEHYFFRQARSSKDNPYHDFYIWSEKPNGWKSVFGGKAWTYNPATKEYYLHSFDKKQPDLNWSNPRVRKEMCSVIDFWTDKGVDGFRCDVLDFIAKDFAENKMFGGKDLPAYIAQLFGRKKTARLFTVGECQANKNTIRDICGLERGKLSTVFQFDHMRICGNDKFRPKPFVFDKLKNTLVRWQNFAQKQGLILTLFTDNHDYPFFLSKHGQTGNLRYFSATMYATMVFLLRGIPFVYQGQEYGCINPYYKRIEDFNDVESKNRYQTLLKTHTHGQAIAEINVGSRDNTRRPFAWTKDKTNYHGFSSATPWLLENTHADTINLQADKEADLSVFRFYQRLFALRKECACLRYGIFKNRTKNKNAFVYERVYGKQKAFIVCNYDRAQTLDLPPEWCENRYVLVLNNLPARISAPFSKRFAPFETAVYITKSKA